MEPLYILLGLGIPVGLFAGWVLGVLGWRQARALRREVAALRQALREAGIAVPEAMQEAPPPADPAPWPPPPRPPQPAAPMRPAAQAAPEPAAAPNPWAAPPPPADAPDPTPAPAPAAPRPGLEEALTLRWGTWLGAGALLLAGVFLVRYAVEEGWLGPAARCTLAALLGLALVVGAEWLRRRPAPERPGLPWPDQAPPALAAGGVAVLFGAAYGAAVMYALVPPLLGFALLGLAAAAGIALALLQGPLVAAVGIAGAYVTPALVETQDPSLPGLFAYLVAVTAAALLVLRQVGAAWLGWAVTIAVALWTFAGAAMATEPGQLWVPALFLPVAAFLQVGLLPGIALEGRVGRRLAWIPFAVLALVALVLLALADATAPPAVALLLLTPIAVWKGAREPRMDRLPWVAAAAGLLGLLAWPLAPWMPPGEAVTAGGVVQGLLPGLAPWPPEALRPFLLAAFALSAMHAAAGAWQERAAARRGLRWAALAAAVPVLVLLVAYARARGFALDARWALAAAALAAGLVGLAALAARSGAMLRAGAHAAGAVAALALGCAMVLAEHWLTLAVALFLPPLAWIEDRTRLRPLRWVALAVATVVLVRLLLNPAVLDYDLAPAWRRLNGGLLLAYGVPALCFGAAARMFRARRDDRTVAVLEAGAVAFLAALVVLQIRHAFAGDPAAPLALLGRWSFAEAACQVLALSLLATLLRLANRRGGGAAEGRPVLAAAWRALQVLAAVGGALLLAANPAMRPTAALAPWPVFNELALAYALPALLAAAAALSPEGARPRELRGMLSGYALVAAFAWVTLEVRHRFQPEAMLLALAPPGDTELYAYSGAWLVLGAALLALGVRRGARALRLAALGVIAATVLKAFLVDMAELTGLLRVLSFLGLGLALIALGWVYRRFVVTGRPPAALTPPAPAPPA